MQFILAFICFMKLESYDSEPLMFVHQDRQLCVHIEERLWLRILSVYVHIAVKRFTQAQCGGYARKQLENFVTIKFHAVTASSSWTYGMYIVCIITGCKWLPLNVSKVHSLRPTNQWHASYWAWTACGAFNLVILEAVIVSVKS